MAHVGNIHGTATMDPTGYTVGLRQMAQETYRFQQSIQSGSYGIASMGGSATRTAAHMNSLNRSVYASMTAFYMLTRQIGGAMNAYEEYDNIVARIGSTADMSTSSILGLSEALKGLNRQMAGNRTDLMKGMYRAVQAGFTSPSEFVPIAESAMRLRTASGREINTTKSADAISVIRNALGVKSGREGFITDMLLRGRDVGRFELNEMTSALAIPLTIYGNQYSQKIGAEETLRQVVTLLASTTKAGLSPNRAATGIRRILERSLRLGGKPEGIGKELTRGVQGLGYKDIYGALDEGIIPYMRTLLTLTGGGTSEGLTKMGFGSREMMVTAAALSRGMSLTDPIYAKLASSEIAGTTDKYIQQQQESWWYQRDKLRSAYLDTQLSIMEAMLPTMKSFAVTLETINDLFQSLSPAIRNLIGLIAFGSAGMLMKNFFFRPQNGVGGKSGGFAIPPAGAMGGYYAGRSANLGLTYNKDVQRIMNPSPVGNRSSGPNYRYRGPSGFVKPIEYASFDPSAYVPQTPHVSAFRRNVGNAWRFTWGGQAVRERMIGDYYNSRIEGRQQAFNESRRTLAKQASGVYNNAVAGGMPHERAAAMAGNAFADSLSKMTDAMNAANKSTRFWTGAMNTLSSVMGTVTSVANMGAIGMLFQHILAFIEGLNHSKAGVKTGGVVDLTNAGKTHEQKNVFVRAWEESLHGSKIFASLFSDDGRGNAADLNIKEMERRGYVLRSDSFEDSGILGLSKGQLRKIKGVFGFRNMYTDFRKMTPGDMVRKSLLEFTPVGRVFGFRNMYTDFRKMTPGDMVRKSLLEEFTPVERASFYQGTDQMSGKEFRDKMEKYASSGDMGFKVKGIFADDFLQRSNVHGKMSGQDVFKMVLVGLARSIIENTEAQNKNTNAITTVNTKSYTGVNLSFMEKLRGASAPNQYLANKFWEDAEEEGISKEDYNEKLRKQFMEGGFLPDEMITGTKAPRGSFEHQQEMLLAQLGVEGSLKPNESIYDFLARTKKWSTTDAYTNAGGTVYFSGNKKGAPPDFQSLMGTAALSEALPKLSGYSATDVESLIGKIVGEDAIKNPAFMAQAKGLFNKFDSSKYVSLVDSGKFFTNEVQKYSSADVFGTNSGYNAMLPTWDEKGDAQKETNVKLDELKDFVRELIELSKKTADNTEVSASALANNTTSVDDSE